MRRTSLRTTLGWAGLPVLATLGFGAMVRLMPCFTSDLPLSPPPAPTSECLTFLFRNQELLVTSEGPVTVPRWPFSRCVSDSRLTGLRRIGTLDGVPCYAARWNAADALLRGLMACELRDLYGDLEATLLRIASRAIHLLHCDETQAYCGNCGAPTVHAIGDGARVCTACGQMVYPRLSPSIIVAVTRGDEILLARGARFPRSLYSVLAGFVEPGETLEECVHREVREEVGIEVCNLKYFGSQPWPYPDSLMIGFTAEYASGELTPDPSEILEARWFRRDALPIIPKPFSISRRLIDHFVEA